MPREHPDAALVADLIGELTAWLDVPTHDPTSQVTGGGAVRLAEERFACLHARRPSLLLPSATYGMCAALLAAGVGPGKRVLIPELDWSSTLAAVRSIGAQPVPAVVDVATGTVDPSRLADQLDKPIDAVVVSHLHGVPADVPAVRAIVGGSMPIIEDCAQALGSTLDGQPVGTFGDLAIFSFGPNKAIDVGEAAIVTCASHALHQRLIELTSHPVRQVLSGINSPTFTGLSIRVAPCSAIRLAMALARWRPSEAIARHAQLSALARSYLPGLPVLGVDTHRQNAALAVPIQNELQLERDLPLITVPSTALHIRRLLDGEAETASILLVQQAAGADRIESRFGAGAREK